MVTELGSGMKFDLQKLIATRLLIQANSGGGKSYALRKLLEVTYGHVQHIVLDIEGDFASLRERFDYVLAGKNADIAVTPKTAEILAQKVLELSCNIIIDLYELKHGDRIVFVRRFLEALINAPKNLWHPALVVVDEAHIFCPEKGNAESQGAVIDLQARGRKRGFCGVLATQRLSKLHKDAAAECNNKIIGRTGLDIDMKRAAEELGFARGADTRSLRDLEPGEFFVLGPAFGKSVHKGTVGEVATHHPRPGEKNLTKPAPTSRVREILAGLQGLEEESESEVRDRAQMRSRIQELESELRSRKTDPKIIEDEIRRRGEAVVQKLEPLLSELRKTIYGIPDLITASYRHPDEGNGIHPASPHEFKIVNAFEHTNKPLDGEPDARGAFVPADFDMSTCERKIMAFLLMRRGHSLTRTQVAVMTGYSVRSGNFQNCISKLKKRGCIEVDGQNLRAGKMPAEIEKQITSGDIPYRLEDWVRQLSGCERAIYDYVLSNPGKVFSRMEVAKATGYHVTSGNFVHCISKLNTLGLIKKHGTSLELNPEIRNI